MSAVRNLSAIAVVALALAAIGGVVATRSGEKTELPYETVRYDVDDVRLAFAGERVRLDTRARHSWATTLGNRRDVLEVDVFGEPATVRSAGFHDLESGPDCTVAAHLAVRWRGNVRAILNCDLAADDARWIARIDRALRALG